MHMRQLASRLQTMYYTVDKSFIDPNCLDTEETSKIVSIPIPEIQPEDLELNENCKYCIGPKTLSIMGKLNGRIVMVKTYQKTTSELEIFELFKNEVDTIR